MFVTVNGNFDVKIPRPVKSSVLSVKAAVGAVRVMPRPLACSVLC